MGIVRIVLSGYTGKTGHEMMNMVPEMSDVEIIGGIARHTPYTNNTLFMGTGKCCKLYTYKDLWDEEKAPKDFDVMVDFSHPECFYDVLDFAVRKEVPLMSGTSGLDSGQMRAMIQAAHYIPVFHGGNFRFKVKKFIDKTVEAARNTNGHIILFESFYEGKSLPSETSKVIRRRIYEATGKTIEVYSEANLPKEQLPCNWKLDLGTELRNSLTCHTIGFDELAHDVLEIAKVMATKPVRKGAFYDLDEIWDELPTS